LDSKTWKKFECQSFEKAIALFKKQHPDWLTEFANQIGIIEATYSSLPEEERPRVLFIMRVMLTELGYAWPLADERERRSERSQERFSDILRGKDLTMSQVRAISNLKTHSVERTLMEMLEEGLVKRVQQPNGHFLYSLVNDAEGSSQPPLTKTQRNEAENKRRVLAALTGDMLSLTAIRAIAHMSRLKINEIVKSLVSEGLVVSEVHPQGDRVYGLPGGKSLQETMLSRIAAVAQELKKLDTYNPRSLRREIARRACVPGKLLDQHRDLWAEEKEVA